MYKYDTRINLTPWNKGKKRHALDDFEVKYNPGLGSPFISFPNVEIREYLISVARVCSAPTRYGVNASGGARKWYDISYPGG